MKDQQKVLLVDDEPDIREFIEYNLVKEGYTVECAENGKKGLEKAKEFQPDLILLDIMMPDMDGIEVCSELRSMDAFKDTLIAFLTARKEDFTQIASFESGGDDFINKPIKPRVLMSRVKALLKRKKKNKQPKVETVFGDLKINEEQMLVYLNGEPLTLTKKEFEILLLLSTKPGKIFNRTEIFQKVWGNDLIVGDRTIDVHIRKIREKVGDSYIKTKKGVGYKFDY